MVGALKEMEKTHSHNTHELRKAFGMVDMHQQVLMRLSRDTTGALVSVRRLQVDGDVTKGPGDLGVLKLREDNSLDMHAYYEEYRKTAEAAGDAADVAVVLWSHGYTPEEAVERATVEHERRMARPVAEEPAAEDLDYEVEQFGGNLVQNHHQQDEAVTPENG